MALALALKLHGVGAEIFEARERAAVRRDARVLALSEGARQILDWLGIWSSLSPTPIRTIHVSHRGGFGRTCLQAAEQKVEALGWVLTASDLIAALDAAVANAGIAYRENAKVGTGDTAAFPLTAFAEGAVDATAGKLRDYGQHAVLCSVSIAGPHRNVAYERFTNEGPVALLPLGEQYAVVLTCADAVAARDQDARRRSLPCPPPASLRQPPPLHRGRPALGLSARPALPATPHRRPPGLARQCRPDPASGCRPGLQPGPARHLGIGEDATGADDPGAPDLLDAYARGRLLDRRGAIGFTDLLLDSFASDFPLLKHARGAGLLAMDMLPPLRDFVAKRMIYGARAWP
jgi:2-octaprenyl-6-methoxyphenol hydroxylase